MSSKPYEVQTLVSRTQYVKFRATHQGKKRPTLLMAEFGLAAEVLGCRQVVRVVAVVEPPLRVGIC